MDMRVRFWIYVHVHVYIDYGYINIFGVQAHRPNGGKQQVPLNIRMSVLHVYEFAYTVYRYQIPASASRCISAPRLQATITVVGYWPHWHWPSVSVTVTVVKNHDQRTTGIT